MEKALALGSTSCIQILAPAVNNWWGQSQNSLGHSFLICTVGIKAPALPHSQDCLGSREIVCVREHFLKCEILCKGKA